VRELYASIDTDDAPTRHWKQNCKGSDADLWMAVSAVSALKPVAKK